MKLHVQTGGESRLPRILSHQQERLPSEAVVQSPDDGRVQMGGRVPRRTGLLMATLALTSSLVIGSFLAGCTDKTPQVTGSGAAVDDEEPTKQPPPPPDAQAVAQANFAVPQEELAKKSDAVKATGTITVKGYNSGLLQIDVVQAPKEGSAALGTPPVTVARFKAPGPYELLLPPGAGPVNLNLILDLKGNGPDSEDPRLAYDKNPVVVGTTPITGLDFLLDKDAVESGKSNVAPPGSSPPGESDPTGGKAPAAPGAGGGDGGGGQGAAPAGGAPSGGGGNPSGAASPSGSASPAQVAPAPATAPASAPAAAPSNNAAPKPLGMTAPAQAQPTAVASAPVAGSPAKTSPTATKAPAKNDALSTLNGQTVKAAAPSATAAGATAKAVGDVLDESLDGAPRIVK